MNWLPGEQESERELAGRVGQRHSGERVWRELGDWAGLWGAGHCSCLPGHLVGLVVAEECALQRERERKREREREREREKSVRERMCAYEREIEREHVNVCSRGVYKKVCV